MNTRVEAPPWIPGYGWWVMLVSVVTVGLLINWAIASGLLILLLAQVARPFDFLMAFLLIVGGASVVDNAGGGLTFQLGLLSAAILLMLVSYALECRGRALSISRTTLAWPLLAYVVLSLANSVRGILAGYSLRYLGLELIALLALGSALLVANAFDRRRDLRLAVVGLIVVGLAAAARGFYIFAITKTHSKTDYTMAAPGIVGLLLVNLALRARTRLSAVAWTVLSLPMFLQQFITFGRGLWTGCLAGLLISFVIFAGFGRGSAVRWRRAGLVIAMFVGLGLVGAVVVAVRFGQTDILFQAGSRLTSITGTKISYETRSNLIRLGEYLVVIKQIKQSPLVGYGVGYTFTMKQAFTHEANEQWGVHQNFLYVWLKQGLIGLALFVWVLFAAIATGAREARRRADPWESTWFAATAAGTLFLAVFSLSNYPFAVVNETFLLALLWGGTMAMTRKGFVSLRWSAPAQAMVGKPSDDRPASA